MRLTGTMTSPELLFLGCPQLILEGRDLTPDAGAKGMALLALLAHAAPAPMPRERIAGTLWSEKREEAARYRLRHALWDLRRMPGADWIQSDQNACWFDLGAEIKIDLVEFQRGCDRVGIGTRQPKATAEDAPALSDLAALYGGRISAGPHRPRSARL
jgi:DNA-binding SARP family transcriptional activator